MPRRYRPPKRVVEPDIRFNSIRVQKFINRMMIGGKKSVAQGVMYDAMELIAEHTKKDPLEVFDTAMRNVVPPVEVKPRRVGGATYQIPVEVPQHRQLSLAIRWILGAARKRAGRGMAEKLSRELMDAAEGTGSAVKKREDNLKMAEANRAFAHLRW
ncbi:MAG: 30S ribosomal protein S7 [Anaerolineae bacterium]|nr:30S ribosomal protein S7 [Anaerolineae bacterium]